MFAPIPYFFIRLGLCGCLLLCCLPTRAQWRMGWKEVEGASLPQQPAARFADSLQALAGLREWVAQVRAQGYVLASVDSLAYPAPDSLAAMLYLGPRVGQLALRPVAEQQALFAQAGLGTGTVGWEAFGQGQQRLLQLAAEQGYPRARLQLEVGAWQDTLPVALSLQWGSRLLFDSLQVRSPGRLGVRKDFLLDYLGLKPGAPLLPSQLRRAERRLRALPFLQLTAPPQLVADSAGRAYWVLALQKRKVDRADGLLGLGGDGQGNTSLTGQVDLRLHNLFGRARLLALRWQRPAGGSQQLDLQYRHPLLAGLPLELQFAFSLRKQDSAFLNIDRRLALALPEGSWGRWRLELQWKSGRQAGGQSAAVVPGDAWRWGLGWELQRLDDPVWPREGYMLEASGRWGSRDFLPSEAGGESPLPKEMQWEWGVDFRRYVNLGRKSTLFLRSHLGGVHGRSLFMNDLLPLGGVQTLRGFAESSFWVSAYGLQTAEWRYYLEEQTFWSLFAEGGALKAPSQAWSLPLSVGTGLHMQTRAGMFQLQLAVGRTAAQSMDLRATKVHFGYVNRF